MKAALKNCLLGCYLLLQSPSGIFSLLALACITFVTFKQPSVGGMAFSAFMAVVPAILSVVEHRETMAALTQQQNISIVQSAIPPRGSL